MKKKISPLSPLSLFSLSYSLETEKEEILFRSLLHFWFTSSGQRVERIHSTSNYQAPIKYQEHFQTLGKFWPLLSRSLPFSGKHNSAAATGAEVAAYLWIHLELQNKLEVIRTTFSLVEKSVYLSIFTSLSFSLFSDSFSNRELSTSTFPFLIGSNVKNSYIFLAFPTFKGSFIPLFQLSQPHSFPKLG